MSGKWYSEKPTECDICHGELKNRFVDGKTSSGPWAIMCTDCHRTYGLGLGIGRGQLFDLKTLNLLKGGYEKSSVK